MIKKKLKAIFSFNRLLQISFIGLISKSIPFTWIFWDSLLSLSLYKKQKFFPDQALRITRFFSAFLWLGKLISSVIFGFYLLFDGFFSIFRYRKLKITKSIFEDLPRVGRIIIGVLLILAF